MCGRVASITPPDPWHDAPVTWTVARLGFAPIKGTRHVARSKIVMSDSGPVGDRRFCLVDPVRQRALRTVENPQLIAVTADWHDPELSCTLPDGTSVTGAVTSSEAPISFDYWGRQVTGHPVEGPWADAFGRFLGTDLEFVVCEPGDVVFGDEVTLITTSSVATLSRLAGRPIDPARLRATAVIDDHAPAVGPSASEASATDPAPTDPARTPPTRVNLADPVEAGWLGQDLSLGTAVLRVTAPIARCAVIDSDPLTGIRDGNLLRILGAAPRRDDQFGDPIFGVQATVIHPGGVRCGDPVNEITR